MPGFPVARENLLGSIRKVDQRLLHRSHARVLEGGSNFREFIEGFAKHLHHLGMVFVPIVVIFSAISIAVLMYYDIDRYTHERNIERLGNLDEPDPDAGAKAEMTENIPASARVS